MASRFWVGGTGTWDSSTTTHWASTTGGAGGASAPTSTDAVTFDANSGGGIVTPSFGGSATFQSVACGTFTGTLDFSVNNDSVTLTSTAGFSGTGTGLRTIKLGSGTFTISSNTATLWNWAVTTNLTFDAGTSVISFTNTTTGPVTFAGGGLTYSTVSVAANAAGGAFSISQGNTFTTLSIAAPNMVFLPGGATQTITNAFSFVGTSSTRMGFVNNTANSAARLSVVSGSPTFAWTALWGVTCQGGATFAATNSLDLGFNSGVTITAPSGGAGGGLLVNPGMSGGMS